MREINPRPSACVCVARWDGQIVFNKPHAYDAYKQGDTPGWKRMTQERMTDKPPRMKWHEGGRWHETGRNEDR